MKVELVGVKGLITAINKVEKGVHKNLADGIQGAALRTVAVAKSRLQPSGSDGREMAVEIAAVRQSINHTFDPAKMEASVFAGNTSDDHMAAYLEFGTGKHAARYVRTLPKAFQILAIKFYKNGKGTLREHPFLIPAYIQEGNRFFEKLKNKKIGW